MQTVCHSDGNPERFIRKKVNLKNNQQTTKKHSKLHILVILEERTIRIHHKCDGWIEKSVPRITDWHHEACRVMTKTDFAIPPSNE